MDEHRFLAEAIGKVVANILGDDAAWVLIFSRPQDELNGVVSTVSPQDVVGILASTIAGLLYGDIRHYQEGEIKLDEKPS